MDDEILHLLHTHGHIAEDGLADLRAAGHEGPEGVFVELQQMRFVDRANVCSVWNIRQQRELAEGAADREYMYRHLVAIWSGLRDAELALEKDKEVVRDLTLAGDKVAIGEVEL